MRERNAAEPARGRSATSPRSQPTPRPTPCSSSVVEERREQQGVAQPNDAESAGPVDDAKGRARKPRLFDEELPRAVDHVLQSIEEDLDRVLLRLVDEPLQRQPSRDDLVTDPARRHLDLGALADHRLRKEVEERSPFLSLELSEDHGSWTSDG